MRNTIGILSQRLFFFFHRIMTLDKWLQGKCAKWVPLLFTACHRQMQYKEKMNASSFHPRMSLLIKGSCSLPIPTMIGLDTITDQWCCGCLGSLGKQNKRIVSHSWNSLQSHRILAEAEEALFIFSTGVTFLVFKLPFWLHTDTYGSFTSPTVSHRPAAFTSPKTFYKYRFWGLILDILNQNLHFKQDVQVMCMFIHVGESLMFIRWSQPWLHFEII